jgi:hypothetical protein
MDRVIEMLIDTARQSPSIHTHAAILMKNKIPLHRTAAFNNGIDHAEMRSCSKYVNKGLREEC